MAGSLRCPLCAGVLQFAVRREVICRGGRVAPEWKGYRVAGVEDVDLKALLGAFLADEEVASSVPPDISLCLFRVLQEALHNSAKHSGARRVEVLLWGTSGQIDLTVRDSGVGFDSDAAKESRGLGLISMQERVKLVKGELSITSQPGCGTTIRARVPFSIGSDSMRVAA